MFADNLHNQRYFEGPLGRNSRMVGIFNRDSLSHNPTISCKPLSPSVPGSASLFVYSSRQPRCASSLVHQTCAKSRQTCHAGIIPGPSLPALTHESFPTAPHARRFWCVPTSWEGWECHEDQRSRGKTCLG